MATLTNLWLIFKSIVSAIGRLLYLLLIKLFLIIPTLYVLAIWIASLCVPFRLGDYAMFLIIGATLCTVLSALLVLRRTMLVPVTKKKTPRTSIVSREVETNSVEDARPQEERHRTRERDNNGDRAAHTASPVNEDVPYFEDTYTAYTPAPIAPEPVHFDIPPAAQGEPVYPKTQTACLSHDNSLTQPKYYRSRRDPTLYLTEYPAYMEFYRKTPDGRFNFLAREEKDSANF